MSTPQTQEIAAQPAQPAQPSQPVPEKPQEAKEDTKETQETQGTKAKSKTKKRKRRPKEAKEQPIRKRARKSSRNLVENYDEPTSALKMKKRILGSTIPKLGINREARALLKKIHSHNQALSDEAKAVINPLYRKVKDYETVEFMAKCLLHYEQQHNFVFLAKHAKTIERALANPKSVKYSVMLNIYQHYLCGIEELHRYYGQSHLVKPAKRVRATEPSKKPKKVQPYNLYICTQWKERREEFQKISKEQTASQVMVLLSTEWKNNPNLKTEYQRRAKELNDAQKEPVQESSL